MSGNIQEVNEANFNNVVLQSDIPVLVDCWAPWCMPCRAQQPILEKVADELQGKTLITSLNIEENHESIEPLNQHEVEEFDDEPIYCVYVDSVFSLYPSGKYYMPFAHSNVTAKEALLDEVYREALDEILEKHGLFAQSGEGDPCDIFFCKAV